MTAVRLMLIVLAVGVVFSTKPLDSNAQENPQQILLLGRGSATAAKWSPDGQTLAVSGSRGLWFYTNQFVDISSFQSSDITTFDWSPDGRHIVFADTTYSLKILNWTTNEIVQELAGHSEPDSEADLIVRLDYHVTSVQWSPDSSKIISGTRNDTVIVWEAESGQPLFVVDCAASPVAWKPGSSMIAFGINSDCGTEDDRNEATNVALRNLETSEQALINSFGTLQSIAWHPSGSQLAISTNIGEAAIWDIDSDKLIHTISTGSQLGGVVWNADGSQLLVTRQDLQIEIWNTLTWQKSTEMSQHRDLISDVDWNTINGQIVSVSSRDRTVQLWDAATGENIEVFEKHTGTSHDLAWSPNDSLIATTSRNRVWFWDTTTGAQVDPLEFGDYIFEDVFFVAWSPDETKLAVEWGVRTVWVGDAETFETLHQFTYRGSSTRIRPTRWHSDSSHILTADFGIIRAWNITSNPASENPIVLVDDDMFINTIDPSPDGSKIIAGREDGVLLVLDALDGTIVRQIEGSQFEIYEARWSPDGSMIATGAGLTIDRDFEPEFYSVSIYGAQTYTLLGELDHPTRINSLAWHPTAPLLAIGGRDVFIRIWDISTQELIATIDNGDSVKSLEWSHDGSQLASLSADGTVRVWRYE